MLQATETLARLRLRAQKDLPGISFMVGTPEGEVRFDHESGENPINEAGAFCKRYFQDTPRSKCVEAMLVNAEKAMEEALASQRKGHVRAEL